MSRAHHTGEPAGCRSRLRSVAGDAAGMGVKVDLRHVMAASVVLRALLVAYGEWQDAHMEVRYTDVDYLVFSDAAALVAAGGSPFGRSTYRYSPLLAFLLVPNSTLHPAWGKLLFSAADLLVGYFVHVILKRRGVPEDLCLYSVAAWLFNPFTFTIGTRGNCEPIVCAIILWIMICLINGATHGRQHFGMDLLSISESTLSYILYLSFWFSMNILSSVVRIITLTCGVPEK